MKLKKGGSRKLKRMGDSTFAKATVDEGGEGEISKKIPYISI
jgi:hypothetical protein